MFDNVHIVLSHTSHPGNIGAAARALKTMGLKNLTLVNPKTYPHPDAIAMAAGSEDILQNALLYDSLESAIAQSQLVIGTSARDRSLEWPMLTPRAAAEKIVSVMQQQRIALLFGTESSGLSNTELQKCHFHVQIPADNDYSSLNIAAAVQILTYEIRLAALTSAEIAIDNENSDDRNSLDYVTSAQMEGFYQHLEQVISQIGFLKPQQPNRIMPRLRRLFQRARVETAELNILRGILTEIERKCS